MSPEDREAHMRRMLEHGRKVQDQFKRDNEEFDRGCRAFWEFMRTATLHEDEQS